MVNRTTLRKVGLSIAALVLSLLQSACVHISREIQGAVIDVETDQVLASVLVTATWMQPGIAGHGRVNLHVVEAVTDEKGEYVLPGWAEGHTSQPPGYDQPHILFFKEGYIPLSVRNKIDTDREGNEFRFGEKKQTIVLERFQGTDVEYALLLENAWDRTALDYISFGDHCVWKQLPITFTTFHKLSLKMDQQGLPDRLERLPWLGNQKKCGDAIEYFKEFLNDN